MKKQYILLSGLILMASGLYAITANDVLQKFNNVYSTLFGQGYLFDRAIVTIQDDTIKQWNVAVNNVKIFVADNSKNLIGTKDPDLINALAKIEKANIDLINAIKVSRGSKTGQGRIFAQIESDMKKLTEEMESKSFTLSSKKEVQRIIITVAIYIESAANKAFKDVQK